MRANTYSQKANYLLTFGFVTVTVLLSILVPNITQVLSIMGGLCSCTLSYTIPLYCWVKLSPHPWHQWSNLCAILFFGVLISLGYASVVSTVYEIATGHTIIGNRPDIKGT